MKGLPELERVLALAEAASPWGRSRVLTTVRAEGVDLPVPGLVIGAEDRRAPTLLLTGGVHGLERVGTHVCLAWLERLVAQLAWDTGLRRELEAMRVVAVPLVNPAGMLLGRRSNAAGVDLMRNAPVDAARRPPLLLGGHRLSRRLPWYRGPAGAPMQPEARALVEFVEAEAFDARAAISIDFHSGFGVTDRLWYPYARARAGFPRAPEAHALARRLTETLPYHVYAIEPQADQYTTHGDLWDHLFDRHLARHGLDGAPYVPWTLEMGSWSWVRKNPRQLFSPLGPFNPMMPHRYRRTMRRHLALVDFMCAAVRNPAAWARRGSLA